MTPDHSHTMPSFDQQINMNWEFDLCLEMLHGILDNLQDMRISLERGLDISTFLSPNFRDYSNQQPGLNMKRGCWLGLGGCWPSPDGRPFAQLCRLLWVSDPWPHNADVACQCRWLSSSVFNLNVFTLKLSSNLKTLPLRIPTVQYMFNIQLLATLALCCGFAL